jgi:hypothetical protein
MARRGRSVLGGAWSVGACLVAVTLVAATSESEAGGVGMAGADAGGASAVVAHARRGEVQPPELDDVEHMCALLTSCERLPIPQGLIPSDFAACVRAMQEEMTSARAVGSSLLLRECGLQSSSCQSLATCALRGARPDACVGRGRQSLVGFCDVDGRALSCFHEQIVAVRDCPRGHEECLVVGGEARCSLGACPGDVREGDKARCSPSQTHLLHCEKGNLASLDCAAFGLMCTTSTDGTAACATAGPACAEGSKRCDGTTAVACHNGHEVRVDCAAAGLVCGPTPGGTAVGACVLPPQEAGGCSTADRPRCDGATIRYCYAGEPRAYFCKAFGFNRCEAGKTGVHCAK